MPRSPKVWIALTLCVAAAALVAIGANTLSWWQVQYTTEAGEGRTTIGLSKHRTCKDAQCIDRPVSELGGFEVRRWSLASSVAAGLLFLTLVGAAVGLLAGKRTRMPGKLVLVSSVVTLVTVALWSNALVVPEGASLGYSAMVFGGGLLCAVLAGAAAIAGAAEIERRQREAEALAS